MKPVVKASIGKIAFTLEEEAYNILKVYIDSLEAHFSGNPSGKEIMEEIEVRLAELLIEKCGAGAVVSSKAAREACDTLGSVKDIDSDKSSEETSDDGPKVTDRSGSAKQAKKLFRNPDDKMIGGVCSGFAAYFDKEPVLFRLIAIGIFLLFMFTEAREAFWIPLAAYLVLWLIIPEAKTVGQKYQMRGDKNTLDSIMENVGKSAEEIGNTAKKFGKSHPDLLRVLVRSVSVVVGIIFIIASFASLLGLAISAAGSSLILPVSLEMFLSSTVGPEHVTLCTITILAALGIPFICLLYGGILMTLGMKSPKWRPGLLLFLLWIASLGILAYFGTKAAVYFDGGERQYATMSLEPGLQDGQESRELRIEMKNSDMDYDYIYLNADEDTYELVMIDGDNIYLYPRIRIHRNDEQNTVRIKESTINFADKNREPAFCSWSNGTLTLSPSLLKNGQRIVEAGREIIISMPEDMPVQVNAPRYHAFTEEQYHTNISVLKDRDYVDLF